MKKILSVICMNLFLSCSFNYDEAQLAEELDSEIADIEMFDSTINFVRGTTLRIHLDEVRIFSQKDIYNLYNLEFQELDKENEVRMEGRADKASIRTDNNDVLLQGDIWVRSNTDDVELETNYIQWRDKDKLIEGSENDLLSLKRDDGSLIQGYGFEADAEARTFKLHSGIVGELVVEEADESESGETLAEASADAASTSVGDNGGETVVEDAEVSGGEENANIEL